MLRRSFPGLSLMLSVGRWGGISIGAGRETGVHVVMGWVAIDAFPFDGNEVLCSSLRANIRHAGDSKFAVQELRRISDGLRQRTRRREGVS